MSVVDVKKFYKVCNPNITLDISKNVEHKKFYIDFSPVRGGEVIENMCDKITEWSPDEPTCQLFTGHIGCGKSTELLRLKSHLEEKGFHVVYFESSHDLDMGDVDISDILIAITRQILENLKQTGDSPQLKSGFKIILSNAFNLLKEIGLPIPGAEGVGINLFKIFEDLLVKMKDSPDLRARLRQQLEPRTNSILEAINRELLEPAIHILEKKDKKGLVVMVDSLDKVESIIKVGERTQHEYLFVDRGEQLKKLKCHMVYTIPLALNFSNDYSRMTERFGIEPHVLPMVPVQNRDGSENEIGMELLRNMVLARAFPDEDIEQRYRRITEIFYNEKTLNRLCRISGGHVRGLLRLLHEWIPKEKKLPLSLEKFEDVIRERRNQLTLAISDDEWDLLKQINNTKRFTGDKYYQELLRGMFVFEYRDRSGSWFDINPILAETL